MQGAGDLVAPRLRPAVAALATSLAALALAAPADAAVFTPTTFADDTPDPQHCVTAVAGQTCSLREAIQAANEAATNDEVVLSGGTYELDPVKDTLEVRGQIGTSPSGTLVVRGTGQTTTTVDGNGGTANDTRVFSFDVSSESELRDLGITGGFGENSSNGGAIKVRDGTDPGQDADVTFTRVWLFGNRVENDGGAISNRGKLTLDQSLVSGNTAGNSGGGIENDDELRLINTTISGNRALGESDEQAGLSEQFEDGNGNGGGIDSDGDDGENNTEPPGEQQLLADPTAAPETPGVFAESSTIAGNTADGNGGGVSTAIDDSENTLRSAGAIAVDPRAVAHFRNSIVSDNTADGDDNCSGNFGAGEGDLTSSQGNNIEDGTSCLFTAPGDLNDTPEIGPLADNGGGTRTHALSSTSPAVGAADTANCPDEDQRRVGRPQGTGCDMGAFELAPKPRENPDPPAGEQPPPQQPQPPRPQLPRGEDCTDDDAPITRLRRRGVRVGSRAVRLRGTSQDAGGSCPSGVQRVEVSMAKVSGTGLNCRFIRRSRRFLLTAFRNCRQPVLFRARGTTSWRFTFRGVLPPGKYRVQARAYDQARNKETPRKRRNIVFFTVK